MNRYIIQANPDEITAEPNGYWVPWEEAQAEIEKLRALVAKRERQIVWCMLHRAFINSEGFMDYYAHIFERPDMTDSGLLAAIDEAMGEG